MTDAGKQVIFSSGKYHSYGKELLPGVISYFLGEDSGNYTFYSYGNLHEVAAKHFHARTHIHSEDLIILFMLSEEGKNLLERCFESIKRKVGDVDDLTVKGTEVLIHTWWDICNDCQSHLKYRRKTFSPSEELREKYDVKLADDHTFLLHVFSENVYRSNPKKLAIYPRNITLPTYGTSAVVTGRREDGAYLNDLNHLMRGVLKLLDPYKEEGVSAKRRRRAIVESDSDSDSEGEIEKSGSDSDSEGEKEFIVSPREDTSKESSTVAPLDVLKWVGSLLVESGNRPILEKHEITDSHIRGFTKRVLQASLWQIPFSYHYGWEIWDKLTQRRDVGKSHPFLWEEDIPSLPLLLMGDTRVSSVGRKNSLATLERKWHKFMPSKNRPHFGWSEIACVPLEEGLVPLGAGGKACCQLCGNTNLTWLHHIKNSHALTELFVGSECVGFAAAPAPLVQEYFSLAHSALEEFLETEAPPLKTPVSKKTKRKVLVKKRGRNLEL